MTTYTQCDFFLLRYVPDAVKDEFVNIGVVVRSPNGAEVRFVRDYSRVLSLDPEADLEWLASLERDLRGILGARTETNETFFRKFEESFSNTLQFSPVKGLEAESVTHEADRLAQIYLETIRRPAEDGARSSVRQRIFAEMKSIFEQAGVWGHFQRDIRAAEYTHRGDPLRLDCGYAYKNGGQHGGQNVKLFH